jgi:UDP-N-acetylmuramoylalanine--D-glutamate ligase
MIPESLSGKTVLVLGAGKSGRAAARLAASHGAHAILVDGAAKDSAPDDSASLSEAGVSFLWGCHDCLWAGDEKIDLVVVSPGIPLGSALHRMGESTGAPLVGELEFGASFLTCPILAVTGTNGKTTTTELLTACLKGAGFSALSAGNIGVPLSQIALDPPALDYLVIEVSSFQLEHAAGLRPAGAILLNVTPDHLDRHGSLENYTALKASLLERVLSSGAVVYHAALENALHLADGVHRARLWLRGEEPTALAERPQAEDWWICAEGIRHLAPSGEELVLSRAGLQMQGSHNLANAAAVIALLSALGIPLDKYRLALSNFQCGPHRIQLVRERNEVLFVDDSKATDVDAMIQALRTLGPMAGKGIHLIAGGLAKGCSLVEAEPEIRMYVKTAFLIGESGPRLAESWGSWTQCHVCASLEEAVALAANAASPRELVLLSPGCASMDMFRSYAERGDKFAAAVDALDSHACARTGDGGAS